MYVTLALVFVAWNIAKVNNGRVIESLGAGEVALESTPGAMVLQLTLP